MAIAPPIVLDAPPTNAVAARRYSILNAAVGPLDMPDNARLADVAYTVPWCGPGGAILTADCDDPPPNVPEEGLAWIDGLAFTAQRAFTCMSHGLQPADVERAMLDRLDASEPVQVEKAVAAQLAASTPTVLPASASIVEAVSALETFAYTTREYPATAVMHVPIGAFAFLADAYQITRESATGIWRAPLGTIVAPNAGLTTTAFVTGLLVLWRSPRPFIPKAAEALDRSTNEYKMIGQRDWIAAWECFAASTVLTPLEGGA